MNKKSLFFVSVALLFGQSVFAADYDYAAAIKYLDRISKPEGADVEGRGDFQPGFRAALLGESGDHKKSVGAAFLWTYKNLTESATRETAVVTWGEKVKKEVFDWRTLTVAGIGALELLHRSGAAEKVVAAATRAAERS